MKDGKELIKIMNNNQNKASARFNMTFDNGGFIKNHFYIFSYTNKNTVKIITESGKSQEFSKEEFETLFTF